MEITELGTKLKASFSYGAVLNEAYRKNTKRPSQAGKKKASNYPRGEDPLGHLAITSTRNKADRRLGRLSGLLENDESDETDFLAGIPNADDQVEQGLQHELGKMVNKDQYEALCKVIDNLNINPTFYQSLCMMGIDEKKKDQKQALLGILGDMAEAKSLRTALATEQNIHESVRR